MLLQQQHNHPATHCLDQTPSQGLHLLEEDFCWAHWVGGVDHNHIIRALLRLLHKLDAIAHMHLRAGAGQGRAEGGEGRGCVVGQGGRGSVGGLRDDSACTHLTQVAADTQEKGRAGQSEEKSRAVQSQEKGRAAEA